MSQQPPQFPQQPPSQAPNNAQPQNSFKRNIIIALIGSPILAAIVTGIFLLASMNKGAASSPTPIPTTIVTLSPSPTPNIAATVNAQATQTAVAQANATVTAVAQAHATATAVAQSLTPQYTLQTLCNAALHADYQTQWNQFDLKYAQGNWHTESEYASDLKNRDTSHNGVANCTVSNVTQNGSSASGITTTTFGDSTTDTILFSLTREAGGVWRINGLQHE